jgi:hypothetical protein
MESKLLERIHEIESVAPISSDEELIVALDRIIEKEEELPWEKRDYDLIEEAVEYKLRLEGVDTEECGRRADELSKQILQKIRYEQKEKATYRQRPRLRRVVCALAAVLTLLALTVGTYAFSPSFRDFTNKMYNQLKDKTWYHSENTDYIITHDTLTFSSLDDLASDERFEFLALPYDLPEEYEIDGIEASDFGEIRTVTIMVCKDNLYSSIYITIPNSGKGKLDTTMSINDYSVNITEDDDCVYGVFESENVEYQIKTDNYEVLIEVIQAMERKAE